VVVEGTRITIVAVEVAELLSATVDLGMPKLYWPKFFLDPYREYLSVVVVVVVVVVVPVVVGVVFLVVVVSVVAGLDEVEVFGIENNAEVDFVEKRFSLVSPFK